jgi:hypothetical protein
VDNRALVEPEAAQTHLRTDLWHLCRRRNDPTLRAGGYRDSLDPALVAQFNDRSGVIVGSGGGVYQTTTIFSPR